MRTMSSIADIAVKACATRVWTQDRTVFFELTASFGMKGTF